MGASLASLPAVPPVFVAVGDESQTAAMGVPSQEGTAGDNGHAASARQRGSSVSGLKLVTSQRFVHWESVTCSLFHAGLLL